MITNRLFETALSIQEPWFVERVQFDSEKKRLDVFINFKRGSSFPSREEGDEGRYKAYDTKEKTWRHLNFFEHECYLHCRVPRVKQGSGRIELVSVPWEGVTPGFTLLFEALVVQLCMDTPVQAVAQIIGETGTKIWRFLEKYVDLARECADYSDLTTIGLDETCRTRGHDYITMFVDLKEKRTVFVTDGKGHETVTEFGRDLTSHGGKPEEIQQVSCDMSPAFIKGVRNTLPNAQITFDKFHIVKIINEAVDLVRKEEASVTPNALLRKTRYICLKNRENLTAKQAKKLEELQMSKLNIKSLKAMHIRENFQMIYNASTYEDFVRLLKKWYFWATHSRWVQWLKQPKPSRLIGTVLSPGNNPKSTTAYSKA